MATFTIKGLNHLALVVDDLKVARRWFVDNLGLEVLEDRGELLIIAVGSDLLAIKTQAYAINKPEYGDMSSSVAVSSDKGWQTLDHYGFFAQSPDEVDDFARRLEGWGAAILKGPYSRSDGRSVYFRDPCGNVGEYLYYKKPV